MERFRARAELVTMPVVIGGKLDVTGGSNAARLLEAGFDAVFEDSGGLTPFRTFLRTLSVRAPGVPLGAG